jgi:4-carboxymuconolactone decarboxylase
MDKPLSDELRKRGLELYKQMGWGENEGVKEADMDLWRYTTDFLFGEIWARHGLSLREKELVTIAVLLEAKADGIAIHMRNASKIGVTFSDIKEVILQVAYYLGMPRALWAMRKLRTVMAETGATFEQTENETK